MLDRNHDFFTANETCIAMRVLLHCQPHLESPIVLSSKRLILPDFWPREGMTLGCTTSALQ